jgi:hypothetical protein
MRVVLTDPNSHCTRRCCLRSLAGGAVYMSGAIGGFDRLLNLHIRHFHTPRGRVRNRECSAGAS